MPRLHILPHTAMTGIPPMTRIWLAALGMIIPPVAATAASTASTTGASPDFAAKVKVKVIDRKPVAEVVLEVSKSGGRATNYWYSYRTKAGVHWVFYKEPVGPDSAGRRGRGHEPVVLPPLLFNEERITFSCLQGSDAVIVTVDLDAAAPKVHEDRFVGACSSFLSGVSFQGVDELVIMDGLGAGDKKLTRDKEGTWLFADVLPYDGNLQSQVSVFTPDYKLVEVIHHTPLEAPNLLPPQLVEHCYLPDATTHLAIKNMERLKGIHRSFIRRKARGLTPTMDGGPDLPMSSMVDMIIQNLDDADDKKYGSGGGVFRQISSMEMQLSREYFGKDGWITAADLPCFNTDYDKTLRDICATYDLWLEYCDSRLLKSLRGVHTAGFFTFFEWEMTGESEERQSR